MSRRLDRLMDELDARRLAQRAEVDGTLTNEAGEVRLERERTTYFERHPFERFWADLDSREAAEQVQPEERKSWWNSLFAAFRRPDFVAATGVCTLFVALGLSLWFSQGTIVSLDGATGRNSDIRFKGGESPTTSAQNMGQPPVDLRFFVERDGKGVPAEAEGVFHEGEQIRFKYCSGNNDYLMILSVENGGEVSVYYPDEASGREGNRSIPIVRGNNLALEGSVVLNDYVGHERFFALFSPGPLVVEHVKNSAMNAVQELRLAGRDVRDLESLPGLSEGTQQSSFWIHKR